MPDHLSSENQNDSDYLMMLVEEVVAIGVAEGGKHEKHPTPQNQADRDYLIMMYEEHAEHARQHETLRGAVAGFVIALVAGLLAVGEHHPFKVGVAIAVLGLLGLLLNEKHYERYCLHNAILRFYRKSLEQGLSNKDLSGIRTAGEKSHNKKFGWRRLVKLRLSHLWSAVYVAIVGLGIAWMFDLPRKLEGFLG
jgi:hypothetical protein